MPEGKRNPFDGWISLIFSRKTLLTLLIVLIDVLQNGWNGDVAERTQQYVAGLMGGGLVIEEVAKNWGLNKK